MLLVEALWKLCEIFIGFPPSIVVHFQFRDFVQIERAVIRLKFGGVFSRKYLQLVVPCMLQKLEEIKIKRITDVLADASEETPYHSPVSI